MFCRVVPGAKSTPMFLLEYVVLDVDVAHVTGAVAGGEEQRPRPAWLLRIHVPHAAGLAAGSSESRRISARSLLEPDVEAYVTEFTCRPVAGVTSWT